MATGRPNAIEQQSKKNLLTVDAASEDERIRHHDENKAAAPSAVTKTDGLRNEKDVISSYSVIGTRSKSRHLGNDTKIIAEVEEHKPTNKPEIEREWNDSPNFKNVIIKRSTSNVSNIHAMDNDEDDWTIEPFEVESMASPFSTHKNQYKSVVECQDGEEEDVLTLHAKTLFLDSQHSHEESTKQELLEEAFASTATPDFESYRLVNNHNSNANGIHNGSVKDGNTLGKSEHTVSCTSEEETSIEEEKKHDARNSKNSVKTARKHRQKNDNHGEDYQNIVTISSF